MADIRVVGKARGGRCVFCHDSLSDDVSRCPECRAAWHRDCGAEASRCPTIACPGPAPAAEVARRRGRHYPAAPRPARPAVAAPPQRPAREPSRPGWTVDRPPPSAAARFGPYSRLLLSGLVNGAVVLGIAALLLYVVTHWPQVWEGLQRGKHGRHEGPGSALVKLLIFGGVLGVWGGVCLSWLLRLPGSAAETRKLLDETTPVLMYLSTYTQGTGKHKTRWARLRGKHGEHAGAVHEMKLDGLLPPWWLTSRAWAEQPVLVYGLPPPGPYVLEFDDGMLALVHPDDETSRRGRG